MSWEEFRSDILKLKQARHHKVTNSVGVYDIYKYIRKNKWKGIGQPVSEHIFYSIIREINKGLARQLINGNDIVFPKLGRLEIRKRKSYIKLENGKVKTNLPIDWDRTLRLWNEDEESFKNKTTIKMEEKEIFKVIYNRAKCKFNNKSFYSFMINRDIKKGLKQNIKEGHIDAFALWRDT